MGIKARNPDFFACEQQRSRPLAKDCQIKQQVNLVCSNSQSSWKLTVQMVNIAVS